MEKNAHIHSMTTGLKHALLQVCVACIHTVQLITVEGLTNSFQMADFSKECPSVSHKIKAEPSLDYPADNDCTALIKIQQ